MCLYLLIVININIMCLYILIVINIIIMCLYILIVININIMCLYLLIVIFSDHHTTATEAVLPWKREDSDIQLPAVAIKQREFPPWINNKDYVNYSSPSNTLLGMNISSDYLRHVMLWQAGLLNTGTVPLLLGISSSRRETAWASWARVMGGTQDTGLAGTAGTRTSSPCWPTPSTSGGPARPPSAPGRDHSPPCRLVGSKNMDY